MLNKISLIGQLGKDPESKFYPNGDQQTTFSLATIGQCRDTNLAIQLFHKYRQRLG